jgi:hypothetical protein
MKTRHLFPSTLCLMLVIAIGSSGCDSGPSGPGDNETQSQYFPLKVGNTWTYDFAYSSATTQTSSGKAVLEVLSRDGANCTLRLHTTAILKKTGADSVFDDATFQVRVTDRAIYRTYAGREYLVFDESSGDCNASIFRGKYEKEAGGASDGSMWWKKERDKKFLLGSDSVDCVNLHYAWVNQGFTSSFDGNEYFRTGVGPVYHKSWWVTIRGAYLTQVSSTYKLVSWSLR